MQWTERERAHAARDDGQFRKPVYDSILLISIQFSAIIWKLFKWFCFCVSFYFKFLRHADRLTCSTFLLAPTEKSGGTKSGMRLELNLLPQNLPETTEVTAVWNFWRIRDRHVDECVSLRRLLLLRGNHQTELLFLLNFVFFSIAINWHSGVDLGFTAQSLTVTQFSLHLSSPHYFQASTCLQLISDFGEWRKIPLSILQHIKPLSRRNCAARSLPCGHFNFPFLFLYRLRCKNHKFSSTNPRHDWEEANFKLTIDNFGFKYLFRRDNRNSVLAATTATLTMIGKVNIFELPLERLSLSLEKYYFGVP